MSQQLSCMTKPFVQVRQQPGHHRGSGEQGGCGLGQVGRGPCCACGGGRSRSSHHQLHLVRPDRVHLRGNRLCAVEHGERGWLHPRANADSGGYAKGSMAAGDNQCPGQQDPCRHATYFAWQWPATTSGDSGRRLQNRFWRVATSRRRDGGVRTFGRRCRQVVAIGVLAGRHDPGCACQTVAVGASNAPGHTHSTYRACRR